MRARLVEFVPGLVAGVVGGIGGYFLVAYLLRTQGWWVPIFPGAIAGLACGQASPVLSRRRGVVNALFVLILVVYVQKTLFDPPFRYDGTLRDYALHLHQLPKLTLLFMAVNAGLGFWWGREQGIAFGPNRRIRKLADGVERDIA